MKLNFCNCIRDNIKIKQQFLFCVHPKIYIICATQSSINKIIYVIIDNMQIIIKNIGIVYGISKMYEPTKKTIMTNRI